jgi:hypothetical protein
MPDTFTDDELQAERIRAEKLAHLCLLHGQMDGGKAMQSVADAISHEQVLRARKRGE